MGERGKSLIMKKSTTKDNPVPSIGKLYIVNNKMIAKFIYYDGLPCWQSEETGTLFDYHSDVDNYIKL